LAVLSHKKEITHFAYKVGFASRLSLGEFYNTKSLELIGMDIPFFK
jgi:hypothetical protein